MFVTTLKRAGIGFLIGFAAGESVMLVSALLTSQKTLPVSSFLIGITDDSNASFLLQMLLTGIIGAISYAGVSFYDIRKWSSIKSYIIHFLTVLATCLTCTYFLGLLSNLSELLTEIVVVSLLYFLVWYIRYNYCRELTQKLNSMQEEWRKHDHSPN